VKIFKFLLGLTICYLLTACQSVNKYDAVPLTQEESHARINSLSSINKMRAAVFAKDLKTLHSFIDYPALLSSIMKQLNDELLKNNPSMKRDSIDYKVISAFTPSIAKDHLTLKKLLNYLSGSYKELNKIRPFYSFEVQQPKKGREYVFIKGQSTEPVKLTFEPNINNDWQLVDIDIRAEDGYKNQT